MNNFFAFVIILGFGIAGVFIGYSKSTSDISGDLEVLYSKLPAKEKFHDYESSFAIGNCYGNAFTISSGGYQIIEFEKRPGGFEISSFRPIEIRSSSEKCFTTNDIQEICQHNLEDLLANSVNTKYPLDNGRVQEMLVYSPRRSGGVDEVETLIKGVTKFHKIVKDDSSFANGFPGEIATTAKWNGETFKMVTHYEKRVRYAIKSRPERVSTRH